jgi:ACS family hexuronate transporter-like MFS transporter
MDIKSLLTRRRWQIALLVCAAITVSYFDRQTLPVAVRHITSDIPIPDEKYAHLGTFFLITYGLMYIIGGKLIDALGTRLGFLSIMVFWSLACASHGLAASFAMLAASRLLLGVGEGGGFPAATKAVAEWFPVRERSTAMGIINAGTAVGGILAPPAIAAILLHFHWPWVFYFSGAAGLLWTVWWVRAYYPPARHPRLSAVERTEIEEVWTTRTPQDEPSIRWLHLFRYKQVWGLVIAKFLGDAVWYFISLWLPKYLMDTRGYDIKQVGYFAWIPWAAAGVGCLMIGSFSSLLLKRGLSLNLARKIAIGISVSVMPCLLFVPISSNLLVIVPFAIGYFGQQAWSTLIMTLPADLFPRSAVGAVAGLVGFGGAMGGIAFGELAGQMLKHGTGYAPIFGLAGTLHILSFFVILLFIRNVRPLAFEGWHHKSVDLSHRGA